MDHLISGWDREWFKRCRRAWDLGSPTRQGYEPVLSRQELDLDLAIRDALAVYYYPAMWDWQPAIVPPLVLKALGDSVSKQWAATGERRPGASPPQDWEERVALGEGILEHYFEWAPLVDSFSPVLVGAEYGADVIDPSSSDHTWSPSTARPSVTAGGSTSVSSTSDRYWLVRHRVVDGPWDDIDLLVLDDRTLASCWAWQSSSLMTLAGVIFNEIRTMVPRPEERVAAKLSKRRRQDLDRKRGSVAQNSHRPRPLTEEQRPPVVEQEGNAFFRRTQIPVSRERLGALASRIGHEAIEMMSEHLHLYPNPVRENCSCCPYRRPCLAMDDGVDVEPILTEGFLRRAHRADEVRLGGLFGLNPNQMRVREHQPRSRP